jgi:hypothetical protein
MKWELTLYGGEYHGKTFIVDAETAEDARRIALQEVKRKEALTYELERVE